MHSLLNHLTFFAYKPIYLMPAGTFYIKIPNFLSIIQK